MATRVRFYTAESFLTCRVAGALASIAGKTGHVLEIGQSAHPSANTATNQIVIGQGAAGTGDNEIAFGSEISRFEANLNHLLNIINGSLSLSFGEPIFIRIFPFINNKF